MSKTKIRFYVLFGAVLAACLVFLASCTPNQSNKIDPDNFPNTVAENAKIDPKYKDVAEDLSKDAVNEFMSNISKIPRLSGEEKVIGDYVFDWGVNNHFNPVRDNSGCIYMDVPASEGYENYPKVIIQSHLDMVGATADGKIDMHKTPVDLVMDEKTGAITSRDKKTNIGADDAEGIITCMSIAKNKDTKHGPLRLLFTTEEETTMKGAKNLSPEVLDANYVLNVDCGPIGNFMYASAGGLMFELDCNQDSQIIEDKTILTFSVKDLAGGHSGSDIVKPRMNAHDALRQILNKIMDNKISFNLVAWHGGTVTNSITEKSDLSIGVSAADAQKVQSLANETFNSLKEKYTDDKNAKLEIENNGVNRINAFTNYCSEAIVEALNGVPQGVVKEDPENKDIPISSCNIGVINMQDGHAFAANYFRSAEEEAIVDMNAKLENLSKNYNVKYNIINRFPAWPGTKDDFLNTTFVESFTKMMNITPVQTKVHAGLECSYFYQKKPSIQVACIGADVQGEHSTSETFYTKSLPTHFASILYVLDHINDGK